MQHLNRISLYKPVTSKPSFCKSSSASHAIPAPDTTMSFFSRVTNSVAAYLTPRKKGNATCAKSPSKTKTKRSPLRSLSPNVDKDTITVQSQDTKKRKVSESSVQSSSKKRRFTPADDEEDFEGSTLLATTTKVSNPRKKHVSSPKNKVDRELMPPPSPKKPGRSPNKAASPQVTYPDLSDLEEKENTLPRDETLSRSTRAASSPIDLESMSSDLKARYQAAMTLPENSGIWAEAERDLFFRLALRGFEPLLPQNWMLDFPTYPLALFSSANSPPPLLQSYSGNDFRATKALTELSEMGKRIRDRNLASSGLRSEPIITATVSSYIDWALKDAKVHLSQRPGALPVHVITTLQKGQTTHTAITAMTAQLHDLAAEHRRAHNIRDSVEVPDRDTTPVSDATHVLKEDDDTLPILTGIMICSSLVVVMTLNAHTIPSASFSSSETRTDTQDETGPRFIATFDFSNGAMDVWNAFAVAIVAMHIRRMMALQHELGEEAGETAQGGTWEFVDPKENDTSGLDDPDT